jgi:Tfp pilus assembly protein PilF
VLDYAAALAREGDYAAALVVLRGTAFTDPAGRMRSLLLEADIALRRRDPQAAHALYVQADGLADHGPEADLGQVRADMLAGEFRRASAFALLVSGEHPDSTEALALGAFLEERAGQVERALAFLEQYRARFAESAALTGAYAEVLIDRGRAPDAAAALDVWMPGRSPQADLILLRARAAQAMGDVGGAHAWRTRAADALAEMGEHAAVAALTCATLHSVSATAAAGKASARPGTDAWRRPWFEPFPCGEGRTGNGFVTDAGTRVVTLASHLGARPEAVWVRNGTGELRSARVEAVDMEHDLAVLRLEQPFDSRWSVERGTFAAPVPGGLASLVGFASPHPRDAAWPVLTPGFLLQPAGTRDWRLNADVPPRMSGSPVFDRSGRLIGVLGATPPGSPTALPPVLDIAALSGLLGGLRTAAAEAGSTVPAKEIYERAQGAVVVVVTQPKP